MILVLNCGSESIKWKVFDLKLELVKEGKSDVLDKIFFQRLLKEELNNISNFKISAVGHRVVHGGEKFRKPLKVTSENLSQLEKINYLAPLQNPFDILAIKACQQLFKNIPQFAVFDTEFFKYLPEKAYKYALPEDISNKFGFRRYGFHGISHEYVSKKAAEIIKKPFNKLKIVSCHLGGGASVAAIKNGKAIDTSMGFTPLEGLVMMTRSGNIDAGIVLQLAKKFSPKKTNEILNKESGIKGLCGESDMLKILKKIKLGDKKSKLALDIFVYSIQKYIGSYYVILGGCDLLVFTGAIGFASAKIRNMVCKDLEILGKTKILAIKSDEELAIARKIKKLI